MSDDYRIGDFIGEWRVIGVAKLPPIDPQQVLKIKEELRNSEEFAEAVRKAVWKQRERSVN